MNYPTQWELQSAEHVLETELPRQAYSDVSFSALANHSAASWRRVFYKLMAQDIRLDSYQSALLLLELSDYKTPAPEALDDLIRQHTTNIDSFCQLLAGKQQHEIRELAIPGFTRWLKQMQLLMRLDCQSWRSLLNFRLKSNHLRLADIAFSAQHQQQSQAYFQQLSPNKGSIFLSEIRAIEQQGFSQYRFTYPTAIQLIIRAFSVITPAYGEEVERIVHQGRLRLFDKANTTEKTGFDACFDTPMGSYVQTVFDGSLNSVIRLAHELGHAVHQALHRKSELRYLPLSDLTQESWAIYFEDVVLNYLQLTADTQHKKTVSAYRRYRSVEWGLRHRMLSQFELKSHKARSADERNALWLALNQAFYGRHVKLEPDFASAWQELHHLQSAPFYLLVYPAAFRQSETYFHCQPAKLAKKPVVTHRIA